MNEVLERILSTGMVSDGTQELSLRDNMSPAEGELIRQSLTSIRARTTLEVGLAYGVSAMFALDALAKNWPGESFSHTAIDPFQTAAEGYKGIGLGNIRKAGYGEAFTLIEEGSEYALPRLAREGKKFDAAIIDGWHTLDHTLVDFFYINKMLNVGGIVVLDDVNFPAINKIVRYFLNYPAYRLFGVAEAGADESNLMRDLIRNDQLPDGERLVINWSLVPPGTFGTACCLKKVAEDQRPWNWFSNLW